MSTIDRFMDWVSERRVPPKEQMTDADSVFLVGLGRFGSAIAATLVNEDVDVMAVDVRQDLVDQWANRLTHVRVADATKISTLEQLGASHYDVAVVAIGTGIEASILTTAALRDAGVKNIWAKAITAEHGRILERVGADRVVYPEREMGERVAHQVTGGLVDYFRIDEGFVLAELQAPSFLVGTALAASGLRSKFGVTVVCIKPVGGVFTYATADTVPQSGDLLIVAGETGAARRFLDGA